MERERDFVRVYSEDRYATGQWIMRPKEIEGLTPQQIKDKFVLPKVPTHIIEVHLPAKSYLQLGTTAPQAGWGSGGAIQYQALERLPLEYFKNPIPIEKYLK